MGERISDEVYECAGCAGEVPVVDAVWLPEPRPSKVDAKARPYCCRECFEATPAPHPSTYCGACGKRPCVCGTLALRPA